MGLYEEWIEPGEFDIVTKDEYDASVKIAQECVEWVEKRIKEIE
jgi:hypothetical protein